jgi:predicted TIM-barrel fold metal-dependent hydrolase
MMYDEKAACAALSGDEFIFDIQTHFFETDGEWITTNPGYVNIIKALAGTPDFGMNHYLDVLFCKSDTKMAVLSCWPGVLCSDVTAPPCGLPMSTDGAAAARDTINRMANSQRLLSHAMILPNDPTGVDSQMAVMEKLACTVGVAAWKLYPASGLDGGFFITDPKVGIPVVQKGIDLGVPLFCIHKGLPIPGFNFEHNQPSDIGPIAAQFPQAKFIVYHSAINAGVTMDGGVGSPTSALNEGPYVDGDVTGVNSLITSMKKAGIGPNQNVFAEMGSSWGQVAQHSVQAAHYLGKLLKYVGENNVCWGTDSLVNGTPQPLIEALRMASIPADMQAQYGYPELTDAIKAKIFGLNSARIYGVDPKARRCNIDQCEVGMLKKGLDEELGGRRWSFDAPMGPKTYAEYQRQGRETIKRGIPG